MPISSIPQISSQNLASSPIKRIKMLNQSPLILLNIFEVGSILWLVIVQPFHCRSTEKHLLYRYGKSIRKASQNVNNIFH